jgi:hypothetical protein
MRSVKTRPGRRRVVALVTAILIAVVALPGASAPPARAAGGGSCTGGTVYGNSLRAEWQLGAGLAWILRLDAVVTPMICDGYQSPRVEVLTSTSDVIVGSAGGPFCQDRVRHPSTENR